MPQPSWAVETILGNTPLTEDPNVDVNVVQTTDGTVKTVTITVKMPHDLKLRKVEVDFTGNTPSSSSTSEARQHADEVEASVARENVSTAMTAFECAMDMATELANDVQAAVARLPWRQLENKQTKTCQPMMHTHR